AGFSSPPGSDRPQTLQPLVKRSETGAARPINLELSILVKVLKEENLWKRALSEHYKRLREPDGEIGRALSMEELTRLETAASTKDSWLVAYCAEIVASDHPMSP